MKHIYTTLIVFFILVLSAQAQQTTIYKEDFSFNPVGAADAALPSGYTTISGAWTRTNSNAVPANSQVSGGHYLRATSTTNAIEVAGISVKGFSKLQVKWAGVRVGYHNNRRNSFPVRLEYSVNNGPYTGVAIGEENLADDGVWRQINNGNAIELPTLPANASTLKLKWTVQVENHQNGYYGIDDIAVTAQRTSESDVFSWATRPYNENPFIVSNPTAQNPYTLDYTAMRWVSSVTGTTVLDTRNVRNERFQSPNKSLNLVQTGATATQGSNISITFDDNMADLRFTLFDVDQHTGQFQDQVVITAVNSLGEKVVLKNENVIRGAAISFNETTGAITGTSGQDIVGSSDQGDVIVMFSAPVKQINIAYYNLDATRASQGAQGIGIYNFSGRVAGIITPLPVELTSFKGQRQSQGVALSWATASELDNKGFEVQVSTDARNFKTIAFVESKVGTTALAQNYSFTHKNPAAGINYYRLRQVDFDGTFEFSKTIAVQFEMAAASSVYPTMATEQITVKLMHTDEQASVVLTDMNGRQLLQLQNPAEREVTLPVSNLQQGMYFVTVLSGTSKETFRVMKR